MARIEGVADDFVHPDIRGETDENERQGQEGVGLQAQEGFERTGKPVRQTADGELYSEKGRGDLIAGAPEKENPFHP